jgi:RHS repeat-associated protein
MTMRSLLWLFLFALLLVPSRAQAFHAPPWDTGHQSFRPDSGDNGTDPGDDDCNNSGSPFEVATGNFFQSLTDLSIPAKGADLEIVRTYNSRDMHSGLFGHGWSFVYDQRLIEVTDGLLTYAICRSGDGKRERFTRAADGSYLAPADVFASLTRTQDGGFVLTDRTGGVRRFDPEGRLTSVADRDGNALSLTYDATGFLVSLHDGAGQSLQFVKGADGKVASVTDSLGRSVGYEYDATGNLVRFTNPVQQDTEYLYDAAHNLTRVTDPLGNVIHQVTYDASDRVSSYTDHDGLWTITYQTNQTLKRNALNQTWTLAYNSNGNITSARDPLAGDERFTYDAQFNVIAHQDRNGNVTQYTYDAAGNVLTMTDALGNVTRFTYEPAFNQVQSVTDPLGHTTEFQYDGNGHLIALTDAAGNRTTMAYDASGQLQQTTDPLGNTTRLSYNAQGQLTDTIDALGNTTRSSFDAAGRLITQTDAEGRTTRFAYDEANRLLSTTDALNQITRFNYDASGNLTSVIDASGHTTTYEYDALNRLLRKTDPALRVERYTYDAMGRLSQLMTRANQTITFTYDAAGRRTRRQSSDNTFVYTYDRHGNVTQVTDNDSTLIYQYDALNRIARANTGATVAQPATSIDYSYDADSNLVAMTSAISGGTTSYTYDALHRVIRLTEPTGPATVFAYDANSRRTRVELPNGVVTQSAFDAVNRLGQLVHGQGGSELLRFDYTYDRVGNRVSLQDAAGGHAYVYDALDRLTQATHPTAPLAEQYAYDAVGNRVSSHLSALNVYDAADQLVEDDRFQYLYDANGNQTRRTAKAGGATIQFAYDSSNALLQRTATGENTTYRYDGLGRRIEKNVNGVVTRYIYDGGDIIAALNGSNQLVSSFTHGPGIDDPIALRRSTGPSFYHQDGLGSIAGVSDGAGALTGAFTYDAFGRVLGNTIPTIGNPYSFAGRELDGESSLFFNRARYYDPDLGRFMSQDPVPFVEGGDINAYAYSRNNPVNMVDPTGELAWFIAPIIGGLVGGGIDLAFQLIQNGGNLKCVDWGDVALSAGIGAGLSMLGPSGPIFGRAGAKAAQLGYKGGILNTGNTRIGWSWHQGRNWFGVHGGKPYTPGHWHRTPIPGPAGHGVVEFGLGGGAAGGAAGAAMGGGPECQCK